MPTYSQTIDQLLKDQAFGRGFFFREGQREAVEDILNTFSQGEKDTYILEAPTGAGKSIIAIAVALTLQKHGHTGYLLASDLGLQSQYERDIQRLRLPWGSVRGVDNYQCHVNNEKFSLGECRLRRMSYEATTKLPCFNDCGYYNARDGARLSPVALLNYSYWLVQRNYQARKAEGGDANALFPQRTFAIFDEAHKATGIVQGHFSPVIDAGSHIKLEQFREFLINTGLAVPRFTVNQVESSVSSLFRKESKDTLFQYLTDFEAILREFLVFGKALSDMTSQTFPKNRVVPPAWRRALGLADWIKDVHCKVEDYNEIVRQNGTDVIVQEVGDSSVTFYCLDEPGLMRKHFHAQAGFKVLMSATIGDFQEYAQGSGINSGRAQRMGSTFNFDRSPIYYRPGLSLAYKHKQQNLPEAIRMVDRILEEHPNERGIIHTGSYEFMNKIVEGSKYSDRLIAYEGSKAKDYALELYLDHTDKVLLGPSITEGLDLANDQCRFQIIFKIPFPSLASTLVKEKMDRFGSKWYNYATAITILQAIGRGVRHKNDWCISYIIDGSWSNLIRQNAKLFPGWFLDRIKIMPEEINGTD